jgi:hypothetical protein
LPVRLRLLEEEELLGVDLVEDVEVEVEVDVNLLITRRLPQHMTRLRMNFVASLQVDKHAGLVLLAGEKNI